MINPMKPLDRCLACGSDEITTYRVPDKTTFEEPNHDQCCLCGEAWIVQPEATAAQLALQSAGWTSVADRLPPHGQYVLVHYRDLTFTANGLADAECLRQTVAMIDPAHLEYRPDTDPNRWWTSGLNGCSMHDDEFQVMHWTPLPEPPDLHRAGIS